MLNFIALMTPSKTFNLNVKDISFINKKSPRKF